MNYRGTLTDIWNADWIIMQNSKCFWLEKKLYILHHNGVQSFLYKHQKSNKIIFYSPVWFLITLFLHKHEICALESIFREKINS